MTARLPTAAPQPWTRTDFEAQLRERGKAYHIHHPFNVMLNTGKATPEQVRGWVANRFCYQTAIPVKDAAILANCPVREVRREWIQRILDHDGFEIGGIQDPGGIEAWLRLAEAVGLSREEVLDERHVIPAVRFAVEHYVSFARRAPWQEAVCSSLTELFAPEIHRQRLATWPEHYPWIAAEGLQFDPAKPVPLVLLPPPCSYRTVALDALQQAGRASIVACTASSLMGIQAAVAGGLGATVLGRSFVQEGLKVLGPSEHWPALPTTEIVVLGERDANTHLARPLVSFLKDSLANSPLRSAA